jgi:hypothetical protein
MARYEGDGEFGVGTGNPYIPPSRVSNRTSGVQHHGFAMLQLTKKSIGCLVSAMFSLGGWVAIYCQALRSR